MARLRTESAVVGYALKARTEGIGARAAGRTFDKSHTTILRWEKRLSQQLEQWSPPAPEQSEITIEGDEIYTRIGENLPPRSV
jgi:transposase-like protein